MRANEDVTELLSGTDRHVRSLVGALRQIVLEAAPDAEETVHDGWKSITYEDNGIVCYITPLTKHVDIGFSEGYKLHDPERILEGHGQKLRLLKVWETRDIRPDDLKQIVREAFDVHTKGVTIGGNGAAHA